MFKGDECDGAASISVYQKTKKKLSLTSRYWIFNQEKSHAAKNQERKTKRKKSRSELARFNYRIAQTLIGVESCDTYRVHPGDKSSERTSAHGRFLFERRNQYESYTEHLP